MMVVGLVSKLRCCLVKMETAIGRSQTNSFSNRTVVFLLYSLGYPPRQNEFFYFDFV